MAIKGKQIDNVHSGQTIIFHETAADTEGQFLLMESVYRAGSLKPAAHYHPIQTEEFEILEGEMMVEIDGKTVLYKRGDQFTVHAGRVHAMWNGYEKQSRISWKVHPALNTEYLLETVFGLAKDGKTDSQGKPNILQYALLGLRYRNEFRIAKPVFPVQVIIFFLLSPISYLLGYRTSYRKYLD